MKSLHPANIIIMAATQDLQRGEYGAKNIANQK